ncbi:hypothetical protein MMC34_002097 [Xylographa carneopallida]|nr:hypothetical protein [Xylographa carneopallida]
MTNISISLQPVTEADFADIARISRDSFAKDRHTMVKAHHAGRNPYNHEDASLGPLSYYLSIPEKLQLVKAVDDNTGRTLGSVIWGFRGFSKDEIPTLIRSEIVEDSSAQNISPDGSGRDVATRNDPVQVKASETNEGVSKAGSTPQSLPDDCSEPDKDDPIKRLSEITDTDMSRWQEIFMPRGTKCMFIVGLSVDPAFQGYGVSTALMRWGTAIADTKGVFCWVHSSESAYRFYKEGFKVEGTLEVNLDEFAPGPPNENFGDSKWGFYVFQYMKRLPMHKI